MMHDNKGFAIITALMVLCILSITGILAMKRSIREVKSAAKFQFDEMGFYAAESGVNHAALEATALALAGYFTEPNDVHNAFVSGSLGQLTDYSADLITLDGYEPTTGIHDIYVKARGKQAKGVFSIIDAEFEFVPAFQMPEAALWIFQGATLKGNPTIDGDPDLYDDCPPAPDIIYDVECIDGTTNCIDPQGSPNFGYDGMVIDESAAPFIPSIVKNNLIPIADYVGPWSDDVKAMIESSTEDDPVVIVLTGDTTLNNSVAFDGYGILFVDGNIEMRGNITWHGPLMSSGAAFVAAGTCTVDGALITGESTEVEVAGTANINYNCDILNKMYNKKSRYRMKWWRNQLPKITVMPNGTIIRR